jgi:maltose O-acetyltransferase
MAMKGLTAVQWTLQDLAQLWWNGLVNVVAGSVLTPRIVRYALYRVCGLKVATPSVLPGAVFVRPGRVLINRGTFVNQRCFFENNHGTITVGENCSVGMEVMFWTGKHAMGPAHRRAGPLKEASIRVGNGCWIGMRAVVLGGVTIGDGCVIAAGAVVTRDCEPDGMYAGIPARRVKDLD